MECAARQHSLRRRLNQEEGAAIRYTPIQPKMRSILALMCSNRRSSQISYGSQAVPPRAQLESFHPQNA